MASPFEKDLGVHQGRIAVADAPDGTFVYELGHALLADANLDVGDFREIKQDVVFDGQSQFVRPVVRITAPEVIATGLEWEFSMKLNGTVVVTRRIKADAKPVTLTDLAISLADSLGPPATDEILFRLELV